MKLEELLKIIREGEGERVEFKEKPDGIGKTLVAFLNTNGGILLVGISDRGEIIGIKKKEIEKIERIISAIRPSPKVKMEKVRINKKLIVVLKVKKSEKLHTYGNIAYIRVGTSNRPLSLEEIYERAFESLLVRFDELPNPFASISDLDKKLVKRYLKERERIRGVKIPKFSYKKILELIRATFKGKVTNAGILFFSKNPQKYFPYAKVRIVELLSLEKREILDEKEVSGSIWEIWEKSLEIIESKLRRIKRIVGRKRVEELEIPIEILREVLANAICHRNYFDAREILVLIFPDRIEVINPGSFPPGVTPENPVHKPRNPIISQYFYDVGIIEKYGSGILAIKEIARKKKLEEPIFEIREKETKVILKRILFPEEDEVSRKILSILASKSVKSTELARILGVSEDTILRRLKKLIEKGLVRRIGKGKATRYAANFLR